MNALSTIPAPLRKLTALALVGLAWSAPARAADDEYGIRWTNGLKTEDVRFNALSANQRANPRMVQVPLDSRTYALFEGEPVLRNQLEDPSARTFMEYVVSCALNPDQSVYWKDRSGQVYEWKGRIGLCPEWGYGPASPECQRWVSACVLTRNNALGYRVLLSGRGDKPSDPKPFQPAPTVRTDPFIPYTEVPVASTQVCNPQGKSIHRDCGFKLEHVGRCRAGTRVQAGAGGVPSDFTCGSPPLGRTLEGLMMLRVCDGLAACDEARALAQSDGTCGTYLPAVSFTCPSSETFSVLSAPYVSSEPGQVEVAVMGALYPAPEQRTFFIREGAFYGNLFGPGALNKEVDVFVDDAGVLHKEVGLKVQGAIYPGMYACNAPTWENADAYFNERLCTLPGMNCVARPLGSCEASVVYGTYSGPRCQLTNATGLGDYGLCMDTKGVFHEQVVSPHLNQPCELVTTPASCAVSGNLKPGW